MHIIFLGMQASGKGTQAILLSKKMKLPRISTGDIFRASIRKRDKLSSTLKKYLDKGDLVPDSITNKVVDRELKKIEKSFSGRKGFILDGYPRTIGQAKFLNKIIEVDVVIDVSITDFEAINRIKNRRVCHCGEVYHLKYDPPRKDGICDVCGDELYQRDDDKKEVVERRLKIYHKKTKPLIDYYKEKKILKTVNGKAEIKKIHKEIVGNLKEFYK